MSDGFRLAADFLVAASLKGSVLILLILAIQWLTRDLIPSRWRHAMWLLVFLRLVVPAGPESPVSVFNLSRLFALPKQATHVAVAVARADRPIQRVVARPAEEIVYRRTDTRPLTRTLGLLSLAGLLLFALRSIVSSIRFERTLRRDAAAQPELQRETKRLLDECRQRLGVRNDVRLLETDHVATPALHGVIRPTLLMPRGFSARFTADELRFVFLHELAHLRRRDVLLNCAISAIAVIHWFNPLVWLATRRVREERELACDEMSLAGLQPDERREYGRTILKLLELFRPPAPFPAVLGILNEKDQIKRRLTMITRFRNHPRGTLAFLALLAGLAAVSLTDAQAGEKHRRVHKIDPAERATLERLDVPVSVNMTNGSLGQLLATLSAQSGVNITQSPEVAGSAVQQRSITIEADKVPAHVVLIETLSALDLGFEANADGVTVKEGPAIARFMILHRHGEPGTKLEAPVKIEEEVEIEASDVPADKKRVFMIHADDDEVLPAPAEGEEKRVFIRRHAPHEKVSADGSIRRDIKMKFNRDGEESSGSLRLEIGPEAN